MKNIRKLPPLFCLLAATQVSYANWQTDYDAAIAQAQRDRKAVFVNFTGSDWCGWCMKLKSEVFSQYEFQAFADRNLILLEIDFPKNKPQTREQLSANKELAKRFRVRGYPTILLLDVQGNEIGRTGYRRGGPVPFIGEVAKMIGVPAPTGTPTPRAKPVQAKADHPLFGGAPLQPPPKYNDLQLKGISGTAKRRFVLVNNQTFVEGETARVKFQEGEVKVRCVEIKKESVILEVGKGKERREVFLNKTH